MKSILVIGMGTLGIHLAAKMQEMGNDVMIVDRNEERVQELSTQFKNSFVGDCVNEGVLRSLGVNNFDICFYDCIYDVSHTHRISSLTLCLASYLCEQARSNDVSRSY